MNPAKITLAQWDEHYRRLRHNGLVEPEYGGPLSRHVVAEGDFRLQRLRFDNSTAALRLWNLLLTENARLAKARARGEKIVGAMKDLGTIPVMAFSLPKVRAFYPDGAWWTPCLMECSDRLLEQADRLGIDATFCPVRAMLPAFLNQEHFPRPDLLICSSGAVCDDFSAIAQRLEHLGFRIHWWEMPRRRQPDSGEPACDLPGGLRAPRSQVDVLRSELRRIAEPLGALAGQSLDERALVSGIRIANQARRLLGELRHLIFSARAAPLPALESLIAEMLALHFCSDRAETIAVLGELVSEVKIRIRESAFVTDERAVRVYWVNPVADLRAMDLLEEQGGRICGTDYMFAHALDPIPDDIDPWEALARIALSDPMAGPAQDRAARIVRECRAYRIEAVVVSRIPGASHCARESALIRDVVQRELGLPVIEPEIASVGDAMWPSLRSRLEALMETARGRRPLNPE